MKPLLQSLFIAVLLSAALVGKMHGQVVLNNLADDYSQNFNSLGTGNVTWSNNSTLTGWYLFGTGNTSLSSVLANDGSSSSAFFANYGTTSAADRSLGAITRGTVPAPNSNAWSGSAMFGLRLENNTGSVIDTMNFGYIGEQWRSAGTTALSVSLDYQIGNPANLNSGTWTSVSGGGFTSPTNNNTGALNGNLSANQVDKQGLSLTSLGWADGTDLWLRWSIPEAVANQAQGLSIDNFEITAIPEPHSATLAVLGMAALLAARRRRSSLR